MGEGREGHGEEGEGKGRELGKGEGKGKGRRGDGEGEKREGGKGEGKGHSNPLKKVWATSLLRVIESYQVNGLFFTKTLQKNLFYTGCVNKKYTHTISCR